MSHLDCNMDVLEDLQVLLEVQVDPLEAHLVNQLEDHLEARRQGTDTERLPPVRTGGRRQMRNDALHSARWRRAGTACFCCKHIFGVPWPAEPLPMARQQGRA